MVVLAYCHTLLLLHTYPADVAPLLAKRGVEECWKLHREEKCLQLLEIPLQADVVGACDPNKRCTCRRGMIELGDNTNVHQF